MKLMVWVWTMALGIALAWGTAAGAATDFVLTGSEHLYVSRSYTTGVLFDSSTAVVSQGGYIEDAYVNDNALLRVMWNSYRAVGTATLYDIGRINVSSGHVDYLRAYNNSSVAISGGRVAYLYAYDSNTVDISDGRIDGLNVRDDTSVVISGGNVHGSTSASGSSSVAISGGGIDYLYASGTSNVDISGGNLGGLNARDGSSVRIHGYDFRATADLRLEGDMVYGSGLLTGRWFDGTAWVIPVQRFPGATIRTVIPEPATTALLGFGLAWLLLRRPGRISKGS